MTREKNIRAIHHGFFFSFTWTHKDKGSNPQGWMYSTLAVVSAAPLAKGLMPFCQRWWSYPSSSWIIIDARFSREEMMLPLWAHRVNWKWFHPCNSMQFYPTPKLLEEEPTTTSEECYECKTWPIIWHSHGTCLSPWSTLNSSKSIEMLSKIWQDKRGKLGKFYHFFKFDYINFANIAPLIACQARKRHLGPWLDVYVCKLMKTSGLLRECILSALHTHVSCSSHKTAMLYRVINEFFKSFHLCSLTLRVLKSKALLLSLNWILIQKSKLIF